MTGGEQLAFGERLRRLRRAAGLTQEALAERSGLTAKGLAALERGRRRRPYPHTIHALADALGLSDDERAELFGSIPDRQTPPSDPVSRWSLPPTPPTALIGRDDELSTMVSLFREGTTRLVTLTGPGGVGKSRLALEVARELAEDFPDGVAFVPLAAVEDPALVLPSIAHALGMGDGGDTVIQHTLEHAIGTRHVLVVLDNVEQILDAAPDIAALIAACPRLALLVTSRAPLRVRAEREFSLQPLGLPDLTRIPTPDEVAISSAAQLFLERARASMPSFTLTQANCSAVAAICRRLDGLPLALELAATRIRILDPTSLLARLDRSLTLLEDGSRDLPSRQQTLRAAISWSYELLRPEQQALFRQVSVFAGGWTLDAAEHVARLGNAPFDVLTALSRLVDHHLVEVSEQPDGFTRFGMLQTIREFAADRLQAHGEADNTRERHAAYFAGMADALSPEIWSPDIVERVANLRIEQENLRAALRWAFDRDNAEMAVRLVATLEVFWWTAHFFHEGRAWLDQAMARRAQVSAGTRARALTAAAVLALRRFDVEPAIAWLDEARDIYDELADEQGVANTTYYHATARHLLGDIPGAIRLYEDSSRRFERAGNRVMVIAASNHLAELWHEQGDPTRSEQLQAEVLAQARSTDHAPLRATVLLTLGSLAVARDEVGCAAAYFEELLDIEWIERDGVGMADIFVALAKLMIATGEPAHAARLMGAAESLLADVTTSPPRAHRADYTDSLATIRSMLDDATFQDARASGHRLTLDAAIAEAREAASRIASTER